MRLIFKHGNVYQKIASINITPHDGSINLALVRSGFSESGWHWDSSDTTPLLTEYAEPQPKTERITIHTSGQINYHLQPNPSFNFAPCLLDLTTAIPVVSYLIPLITALDIVESTSNDDCVFELAESSTDSFIIEFYAIPSNLPTIHGEIGRCIIEGSYGLAFVLVSSNSFPLRPDVPPNAFTLIRPSTLLPQQAISEDQAFIRFQKLMYENQVRKELASSTIPVNEHDKLTEEIVRRGRGVIGPNNQGIWEIVCSVPMRIKPKLNVQFSDSRYRAEIKDMKPFDKRLEKVRVRFEVYDTHNNLIKHFVEITSASLDSRL